MSLWSEECRAAVNALEEQFDIEVCSMEHHETWVNRCERLEKHNARLASLLQWALDNLDSPASPEAEQTHRDQIAAIHAALSGQVE